MNVDRRERAIPDQLGLLVLDVMVEKRGGELDSLADALQGLRLFIGRFDCNDQVVEEAIGRRFERMEKAGLVVQFVVDAEEIITRWFEDIRFISA